MPASAQARHGMKQTPRLKVKFKFLPNTPDPAALYTLLRKTSNSDTDDQCFPVDEPVIPAVQNVRVGSSSNNFPISFRSSGGIRKIQNVITFSYLRLWGLCEGFSMSRTTHLSKILWVHVDETQIEVLLSGSLQQCSITSRHAVSLNARL
jgi:hypothetical protein